MSDPRGINIDDIYRLEDDLDELEQSLNHSVRSRLDSIRRQIQDLKKRAQFELVTIKEAADILGVSQRQVHNLASNPQKTGIHKYNKDGTRKKSSRRTSTRYNKVELVDYKDSKG